MVKITNGRDIFEVTRGAYEGAYSKQGYSIVEDKKTEQPTGEKPEVSEDDRFCEELLEKPIAQWNKEEVKKFAELSSIDISGTKNANEAKAIIKETMGI